ncbi:MAG: J domain-containing protein [Carboxylicivirga sp.]|nr:J domain-containing protein [Carboxylicivirga sp.]
MNFFKSFNNIDELKRQYKQLAKDLHPDLNPDKPYITAQFQQMSNEYEGLLKEALKGKFKDDRAKVENELELDEQLREVLNQILYLEGIEIEICGNWLWVSGDTKEVKDTLKEAGFKWAKKKVMWYWHDGSWKRKGRKTMSMDQIRNTHGSTTIETEKLNKIA